MAMICQECQDRLHAFLDGELPSHLAEDVQAHLEGCAACFRRSQVEEAFRQALREHLRPESAPPALESRILAGLDAIDARHEAEDDGEARRVAMPSWRERGSARRTGWALAAAAALAGLFVVAPQVERLAGGGADAVLASPLQLQGRLQCVGCLLAHDGGVDVATAALLPPGHDGAVDHSRLHDRLHLEVDGRLWSLAPVGDAAPGIFDHDNVGRDVVVIGAPVPDWNVIQVGRLHFL